MRAVAGCTARFSPRASYIITIHQVAALKGACADQSRVLCLFAHDDGRWTVDEPSPQVPPDLPEPVLGINLVLPAMHEVNWLDFVAAHSEAWLLSTAMFRAAQCRPPCAREERRALFHAINAAPSLVDEVRRVNGTFVQTTPSKKKGGKKSESGKDGNTKNSRKAEQQRKAKMVDNPNARIDAEEEWWYDSTRNENTCRVCRNLYQMGEFWICCDRCEAWFHGACVGMTEEKSMQQPHFYGPPGACCTPRHAQGTPPPYGRQAGGRGGRGGGSSGGGGASGGENSAQHGHGGSGGSGGSGTEGGGAAGGSAMGGGYAAAGGVNAAGGGEVDAGEVEAGSASGDAAAAEVKPTGDAAATDANGKAKRLDAMAAVLASGVPASQENGAVAAAVAVSPVFSVANGKGGADTNGAAKPLACRNGKASVAFATLAQKMVSSAPSAGANGHATSTAANGHGVSSTPAAANHTANAKRKAADTIALTNCKAQQITSQSPAGRGKRVKHQQGSPESQGNEAAALESVLALDGIGTGSIDLPSNDDHALEQLGITSGLWA